MNIFEYILLASALSIPTIITFRQCTASSPIRLTRGLLYSFLVAIEHTLLLLVGIFLAGIMRFDLPDFDKLVFIGFIAVVAIRIAVTAFRGNKSKQPTYAIDRWGTFLLLGMATGTNVLFVGLGLGFVTDLHTDLWRASLPMLCVVFLFTYLAIMMGRRNKHPRDRRWLLVALLFLLLLAVKTGVDM